MDRPIDLLSLNSRNGVHFIHEMQILPETAKFAASKSRLTERTRRREKERRGVTRKAAVSDPVQFVRPFDPRRGRTKETLVVTVAHNVCSRSNSSQKGSGAVASVAAAVFLASGKCSP